MDSTAASCCSGGSYGTARGNLEGKMANDNRQSFGTASKRKTNFKTVLSLYHRGFSHLEIKEKTVLRSSEISKILKEAGVRLK